MKLFLLSLVYGLAHAALPPQPEVVATKPTWQNAESVLTPESAYYDEKSQFIFVSNINGEPTAKDGNGFIQKYSASGTLLEAKWVGGLSAPKGMRAQDGLLWVSDIDEVVAIQIDSGKIVKRVPVAGAKFLNDVAIGGDGTVYVSDMLTGKIHEIKNERVSVFVQAKTGELPNGLLVVANQLVVAGWGIGMKPDFSTKVLGSLNAYDLKTKRRTAITKKPLGNLDGLERLDNGDYLVSDWIAGKIYRVSPDGKVALHSSGYKNCADIGLIPTTQTLLVPQMGGNLVSAYELRKTAKK